LADENFNFKLLSTIEGVQRLINQIEEIQKALDKLEKAGNIELDINAKDSSKKTAKQTTKNIEDQLNKEKIHPDKYTVGEAKSVDTTPLTQQVVALTEENLNKAISEGRLTPQRMKVFATAGTIGSGGTVDESGKFGKPSQVAGYSQVAEKLNLIAKNTKLAEIGNEKYVNSVKQLRGALKSLEKEQDKYAQYMQKGSAQTKEISNEYKGLQANIGNLRSSLKGMEGNFNQANNAIADHKYAMTSAKRAQQEFDDRLDIAIGKLIRYRVSFYAMQKAFEAYKTSIRTFISTQYELAQVAKVIQPTADQLESIKDSSFDMARTFGQSIDDVIKGYKIWAQTGLRNQDVINATNATLLAANALQADAVEVTEDLTAAIFTYGVETSGLTNIIDKWIRVQQNYPVTALDLANSMKAVGAAATSMGVSIDEQIGMVAAIAAVTRKTGREVGMSLKTIFARLPREETVQVLQELGIAAYRSENELRPLGEVLTDLAAKWDSLTSEQQYNIAQTGAGIRRYVDFIALMNNFEVATKATADSQAAFGDAIQANQYEVQTFKKQFEQTFAALSQAAEKFGAAFTPVIMAVRGIAEAFQYIMNNKLISRLVAGLSILVGTFVALKAGGIAVRFLVKAGLIPALKLFSIEAAKSVASTFKLDLALEGLKVQAAKTTIALNVLKSATGWFLIISGIATIIYGIAEAFGVFRKSVEDFNKISESISGSALLSAYEGSKEQLKATDELIEKRDELIKQLKSLKEGGKEYSDTAERIRNINVELSKDSQNLTWLFDEMGESLEFASSSSDSLTEAFKDLKKEQEDLIRFRKEKIEFEFQAEFSPSTKNATIESAKEIFEETNKEVSRQRKVVLDLIWVEKSLESYRKKLNEINITEKESGKISLANIKKRNEYKSIIKNLEEEEESLNKQKETLSELETSWDRQRQLISAMLGVLGLSSEAANAVGTAFKTATEEAENFVERNLNKLKKLTFEATTTSEAFDKMSFSISGNDVKDAYSDLLRRRQKQYKDIIKSIANFESQLALANAELDKLNSKDILTDPEANDRRNIIASIKEYSNGLKEAQIISSKMLPILKAQISFYTQILDTIDQSRDILQNQYEEQLALTKTNVSVISEAYNRQSAGLMYQQKELLKLKKYYEDYLETLSEGHYNYKTTEDVIKSIDKSIIKLGVDLKKAQIQELYELPLTIKSNVTSAVGEILESLPKSIIKIRENAFDLKEDLIEAEDELAEAIKTGQEEAIYEAQRRVREVNKELERMASWWRTIGDAIANAFSGLSESVWKGLTDRIAQNISDSLVKIDIGTASDWHPPMVEGMKKGGDIAGQSIKREMLIAGSILAGQIAGSLISSRPESAIGGQLGSTFGAAAGEQWLASGLGLGEFGGPVGALLGGLAGGALGWLIGSEEEELRRSITKNTDAVQANTKALEELSKMVINAPVNYTVPSIGGGAVATVSISNLNINGGDSQSQATGFVNALKDYGVDIRRSGSRYKNRIN